MNLIFVFAQPCWRSQQGCYSSSKFKTDHCRCQSQSQPLSQWTFFDHVLNSKPTTTDVDTKNQSRPMWDPKTDYHRCGTQKPITTDVGPKNQSHPMSMTKTNHHRCRSQSQPISQWSFFDKVLNSRSTSHRKRSTLHTYIQAGFRWLGQNTSILFITTLLCSRLQLPNSVGSKELRHTKENTHVVRN